MLSVRMSRQIGGHSQISRRQGPPPMLPAGGINECQELIERGAVGR
jgi:hypothetical protein